MLSAIPEHIFRAYDIRGQVSMQLTPEVMYAIGQALGTRALELGEQRFIVARDGRLSGPELQSALSEGVMATGCDVMNLGAVPTPLLYHATKKLSSASGAIVTGSHNPPEYNGIKMVLADKTLVHEDIMQLKQMIIDGEFKQGTGQYQSHSIATEYIEDVISRIELSKPLKVVVDCGNAIPGEIAPALLEKLGCQVIPLYCEVDGNFPNHHPDPSEVKNLSDLIAVVKTQQADIGLAFDGDGDRLGVITNKGGIIWSDTQMMLYAEDVLSRNPGAKIVYDVKCTHHLKAKIEQCGGVPMMWCTGHSLIKQKMQQEGALLAGEMSGHIYFKERWYGFDDALYTAARLLEILAKDTRDADQIFASYPQSINTPELRIDIAEEHKFDFVERFVANANFAGAETSMLDGIRVDYPEAWGLLRASNTTPCLILRFEADSEERLAAIKADFKAQILQLDSSLSIPF